MPDKQLADLPLTILRGIGPRSIEKLSVLGIKTVQDILFHLPIRYQDRTHITAIDKLRTGQQVVVDAIIDYAQIKYGRRRSLVVQISDETGTMLLRFFYFSNAQAKAFIPDQRIRCFGEVRHGPYAFELIHPEYELLTADDVPSLSETLTPIYPTTEGFHQRSWLDLTDQALKLLEEGAVLPELFNKSYFAQLNMSLAQALQIVHRPTPDISLKAFEEARHPAQHRVILEEFTAHQLGLSKLRQEQQHKPAKVLQQTGDLEQRFISQIPFELTRAQYRVADELNTDMNKPWPMQRLIQGDVGSGKTLVAALAGLRVISNGYQVAIMVPTELLAEQHYTNFIEWFEPLNLKVLWLSGRHKGKARQERLEQIGNHQADVIIGTHALFQTDVTFHKLALVIIDEQHRFGVHQRLALRQKGEQAGFYPHQLIMTATPIPRTLAMAAYADLDLSIINELPPGRKPVTTAIVSNKRRDSVIQRLQKICNQKRQAYWVCTLIEESESLQARAAQDTAEELKQKLPELTIGLIHGRLKTAEKEHTMAEFKAGKIHLLVATTVIEVGMDVPNASLMIIENPERLGLAQLHQLRGRVGRGTEQSHCLLLYHSLSDQARRRLNVMRDTHDGFIIAQRDLEIRGPGEVLGTKQTGAVDYRVANLLRDQSLLMMAQRLAQMVIEQQPEIIEPLVHRWVGQKKDYVDV